MKIITSVNRDERRLVAVRVNPPTSVSLIITESSALFSRLAHYSRRLFGFAFSYDTVATIDSGYFAPTFTFCGFKMTINRNKSTLRIQEVKV